jgi:formylglycine-generating enzyme required for sulfatase activity
VYDAITALGLSAAGLSAAVQAFILPESDRLLDELNRPIDHKRRAQIGERLAELGDPRAGVGLRNGLPEVIWCPVPGGLVRFRDVNDRSFGEFEVKPFYIAQYPITTVQFSAFTRREIYDIEKWWMDLPVRPDTHPARPQAPIANHPAQFASWYQAIAFCRWLSEELQYAVRLPTEAEWMQAATGGNQEYRYPWGREWDPYKANHRSGAYRLVAVGMYPMGRSPVGAFDMCGNMYQWCLNEFDDPARCQLTGTAPRATRGGAFFSAPEEINVRHRLRDNPDGYNSDKQRIGVCIRLAADNVPRASISG